MPKALRFYLLACVALAFGYLALHVGEPLRLNVGDPWIDASRSHLVVARVLALACSGLAAWLLFHYVRRMWSDTAAIVATALTSTSLLWLQFADTTGGAPIAHAACFLALWGVVRALETDQRRHYLAVLGGTFACLYAASNDWVFLPLGVLFTIQVKRGDLLAPGNRGVLLACAAGVVLAGLLRTPFSEPDSWPAWLDERAPATFAILVRRYTVMLSPLLWGTLAWAVWRALRAPSLRAAVEDGTTWLLVAAVVFAYLPPPRPESATLRTQLLLPFYAIGSGLLIARLFEHGRAVRRALAVACCAAAPVWGLWLAWSHPREVIDSDDLARANDYLSRSDGNNFVVSNLLADGPMLAAFGRHGWAALRDPDAASAHARMLELFEATGTDYIHAIIFTTPGSRFVARSIGRVTSRRPPAVDGWPYLVRGKVNNLIAQYDKQVLRKLEAIGAVRVLQLTNFDIYRIDRASVLESAARAVPVVRRIEVDSPGALRFQLGGWGDPVKAMERPARSAVAGYSRCLNPVVAMAQPTPSGCDVVETAVGLDIADQRGVTAAELVVRVDRVCDQQLEIALAAPARVEVAFNGATLVACTDPQWGAASLSVRVPQHLVHAGGNVLRFQDAAPEPRKSLPEVRSVTIEPMCAP